MWQAWRICEHTRQNFADLSVDFGTLSVDLPFALFDERMFKCVNNRLGPVLHAEFA
jgi:hypothetical protein